MNRYVRVLTLLIMRLRLVCNAGMSTLDSYEIQAGPGTRECERIVLHGHLLLLSM
ncbi:hypothetical protein Hanom_Chr15g01405721 [Helianthus anomalus]